MPRRKPAAGQLSLLGDELPEDPAGLFSRETPPARHTPDKPAVNAPTAPPAPAKPTRPAGTSCRAQAATNSFHFWTM